MAGLLPLVFGVEPLPRKRMLDPDWRNPVINEVVSDVRL